MFVLKKALIVSSIVSISAFSSSIMGAESGYSKLTCGATPEIGCLEENIAKCANGCFEAEVFPQPGGVPLVIHEDDLEKKVNASYPGWYRGSAPNGLADKDSHHYYYTLIGPGLAPAGVNAENIFCASYYLKPGKTYPSHNHPSREFYFITGGEARWYAGGKEFDVKAGSFIMHPPYTPHGITNTSQTELLSAMTCWWIESSDPKDVFNYGGKVTNPCLSQSPNTTVGNKMPLPQCQSSPVIEEKGVTTKKTKD